MRLPEPIQTYFDAQFPQDKDILAAAFAPDAIVHDEGHLHRGPEEIRTWWQASKERYRHHAEPLDMSEAAGKTVVRAGQRKLSRQPRRPELHLRVGSRSHR